MKTSYPMAFATAPGEIAFRDHTPPEVGPQDVKLRVKAVTLCGSDLHIFKGLHPVAKLPSPVGHEISGEIVEIGEKVTGFKIGDRIAVEPVLVCDECYFCRRGKYSLCTDISFQYRRGQGGITPYFVVPGKWVHKLPTGLSYAEGALMEPLSVAIHAVNQSNIELGHTSAVFGAGAIGLLLLQLLKVRGSGEVFMVDIHDYRLEAAVQMGASLGINNLDVEALEIISEATEGLGVDRSFEAVGIETTLVQALEEFKKGWRRHFSRPVRNAIRGDTRQPVRTEGDFTGRFPRILLGFPDGNPTRRPEPCESQWHDHSRNSI